MSGDLIDHPMRMFTVLPSSEAHLPPDKQRVVCVYAHTATIKDGALVLIIVKHGMEYVAQGFATGTWSEFVGAIPTDEELNDLHARAQQTIDARRAFAELPARGGKQ